MTTKAIKEALRGIVALYPTKRLCRTLLGFALISISSSALACSYSYDYSKIFADQPYAKQTYIGENGLEYERNDLEILIDESSQIALVQPRFVLPNGMPMAAPLSKNKEYDSRPHLSIQFVVAKMLKGKKVNIIDFTNGENELISVLDPSYLSDDLIAIRKDFKVSLKHRISTHNRVAFWDKFEPYSEFMSDEFWPSMCGIAKTPMFFEDQSYIIFIGKNNKYQTLPRATFEPVSGIDDAFFKSTLSRINAPLEPTGPRYTPSDVLLSQKVLDVVEIQSCESELTEQREDEWVSFPVEEDHFRYFFPQKKGIHFKASNQHHSQIDDETLEEMSFTYPALFEYFDNSKLKVTCTSGERFLIFGQYKCLYADYVNPAYPFRFARIINDKIQSQDIKTHIHLTDDIAIDVSELFENRALQK